MTTHVAVTFDIEFDINGTFAAPQRRTPRGAISLTGQSGQPSGLPVILDTLDRHGVRATFFVEALQTSWFGPEEMGGIVEILNARGHDIQLHLHPVWLIFDNPDWVSQVQSEPPRASVHDTLVNLSRERVTEIIQRGKATFVAWGLPEPTAIRTGSLFVERHLYPIFRECGLEVSSSVGLGLYHPEDPFIRLYHSAKLVDEVMEVPVSSYIGADHHLSLRTRLATLIGMGMAEQHSLLQQAVTEKLPLLVILSHVSEFHSNAGSGYRRNTLTERKFEQLCSQLSQSPSLQAVTMSELLRVTDLTINTDDTPLTLSRWRSALRFLEAGMQKALST